MDKKEYIERESMLEEITAIMFGKPDIDLAQAAVKYAPAADVVSRGVYNQVQWERDMAMQQLKEHGIPFGGKADVVEVVRCKDCKYYKHFKGLGNWCHRRIRSDIEYHTKNNRFLQLRRKAGS